MSPLVHISVVQHRQRLCLLFCGVPGQTITTPMGERGRDTKNVTDMVARTTRVAWPHGTEQQPRCKKMDYTSRYRTRRATVMPPGLTRHGGASVSVQTVGTEV